MKAILEPRRLIEYLIGKPKGIPRFDSSYKCLSYMKNNEIVKGMQDLDIGESRDVHCENTPLLTLYHPFGIHKKLYQHVKLGK
jgi:hypothetical protein